MRMGINGSNGHSNVKMTLDEKEVAFLVGGLQSGPVKLTIEGGATNGLKISVSDDGRPLKIADGQGVVTFSTSYIDVVHDPVTIADVAVTMERDDYGPVLRTSPLPVPFAPPKQRRAAQTRLDQYNIQHPQAAAEALFRGRAKVERTDRKPTAWTVEKVLGAGVNANSNAIVQCECGCTQEMGLKSHLPDLVISKKFKEQGWYIRGVKATCPDCVGRARRGHHAAPLTMVEAIDHVTKKMGAAARVEQLKAAIALVNAHMDELADDTIRLTVSKNRLGAFKMGAL